MLQILALDTTTRAGSVAVIRNGAVVAEISGDPSLTHGQRLPADLMRVLEQAAVHLDDIDLLAVAAGPGSFTGLRVGIASMQGLAFSRGLKIVPVPTLEALAHDIADEVADRNLIAPWIDALRGEVFAMLYASGLRTIAAAPTAARPDETLRAWREALQNGSVTFAGDGAIRYKEIITAALGEHATIIDRVPTLAGAVGRIAAADPARAVVPHAVVPLYVRRPDAELARDRTAAHS